MRQLIKKDDVLFIVYQIERDHDQECQNVLNEVREKIVELVSPFYLCPGDFPYNLGSAFTCIEGGTISDFKCAISYIQDEINRLTEVENDFISEGPCIFARTDKWLKEKKENTEWIKSKEIELKVGNFYRTENNYAVRLTRKVSYINSEYFYGHPENHNEFWPEGQWTIDGKKTIQCENNLLGFNIVEEITFEEFERLRSEIC